MGVSDPLIPASFGPTAPAKNCSQGQRGCRGLWVVCRKKQERILELIPWVIEPNTATLNLTLNPNPNTSQILIPQNPAGRRRMCKGAELPPVALQVFPVPNSSCPSSKLHHPPKFTTLPLSAAQRLWIHNPSESPTGMKLIPKLITEQQWVPNLAHTELLTQVDSVPRVSVELN